MPKNRISKTSKISSRPYYETLALRSNSVFPARCAGDSEYNDIEATGIASVVFPLNNLATFRVVLNQCAMHKKTS